LSTMLSWNI